MQFKFDANQDFQIRAVDAVADLFDGQPRSNLDVQFHTLTALAIPNKLDLTEDQLLANLQTIQWRNLYRGDNGNGNGDDPAFQPDQRLHTLEDTITTAAGTQPVRFFNFSVEMETGTGKTYVYIRTALELFQRFGFRKFIIVVPSIAIKEGVLKTFQITQEHFRALFDNVPYRFYTYDSANLSQVRQFALSDSVEFMIMTIQAFRDANKNVIHQTTDRLQGETPVHLIQATHPILFLDEPQNMESEKSIAALAALQPLFALRYSATHRNPYNMVFRLTPFEAYQRRLVKRIEVAGITQEDQANVPYIRLNSITAQKRTLTASLTIDKLFKSGDIRRTTVTVRPGDSLEELSGGRPEYWGFAIDEINAGFGFVRFANTTQLNQGQELGTDKAAIFRGQIYYTVEEHLRKQALLQPAGIKVLSLFFIDRVDNYAPADGVIRRLFTEAFDKLKAQSDYARDLDPAQVQAGYFAQRTTKAGDVILEDSKTGTSKKDQDAYELIMKDKERLLSFEEPVSFVFSHSALREGWDNPNVFQICTLNQSVSEMRKRQEIGRGVRLCVNQQGERVHDERVNVLTVVANESYQSFVNQLQGEIAEEYRAEIEARYGWALDKLTADQRRRIEEEYGYGILPPKPSDARKRVTAALRKQYTLKPEFKTLWRKISRKTRYSVHIDTPQLIREVVQELRGVTIPIPRIVVTKAAVGLNLTQDTFDAWQMSGARTLDSLVGRYPLPNLVDIMTNLMENTSPPMRLTRRTLLDIIRQAPHPEAVIANPTAFATAAVSIIKQKLSDQLIAGIQYHPIEDWYQMELFDDEIEAWKEHVEPAEHALYDHVVCDSQIEHDFVRALEHRDDVTLYVKLPDWFKVPTPIGNYNPDWAVVMKDPQDPDKEHLYLIAETKGTTDEAKLQWTHEKQKIHCGRAHFEGALHTKYCVAKQAADLPCAPGPMPLDQ
jgi:type III restriction enzyme